ncbi:carboxypeptidase-like regulatory domain-containing protein [Mucilaginibacter sp.]|uniref:carboxypeptidase-like regulatory domain-containing protein n=1 Tax=Mucilaginibacter sp. TaxID=1882438 RepID=UPI00283D8443|nr:carboxypeptidase-like regulatory domain-containing protein [Mucilaginibacter sp.]MDR3695124.1 carboxypeptidase-like regulatory domain-containing protein [Mucilaginibacter sp.]
MVLKFKIRHRFGWVLLTLLFNGLLVRGQLRLSGTVRDSSGKEVGYASLSLLSDSNKIVRSALSDSLGRFTFTDLPGGQYRLAGSFIGAKAEFGVFRLVRDTAIVLTLNLAASVLKEVVVTGANPLLERKIDRIVFNIENSIAAKGTDMAEAIPIAC